MKNTINKIRSILNPSERRALNRYILLGVVISLMDILFLVIVVGFINITANNQSITVWGYPITAFVRANLLAISLAILALFAIKNIAGYLITQSQYRYSYNVAARLADTRLMQYLQSHYFNYINTDSSVFMYQIGQQPIEFSQYILAGMQQIMVQTALILLSIIAMLLYNAKLFLIITIFIFPPAILVAYLIRKKTKAIRGSTRQNSQKSLQYLKESLSAYIESHIFNKYAFFTNRYSKQQQALNANLANLQSIQVLPSRFFEVFAIAGIFIITVINSRAATFNTGGIITVGVFMAAAYKIIPGVVNIISYSNQLKAFEHVLNDLVPDCEPVIDTTKEAVRPIHDIKFERVKFAYQDRHIFQNLNLELSAGSFTGISSFSGRGKTTLINILLGFLEPTAGQIKINREVANATQRAGYRGRISYVKQSVLLLHDSILNNITLTDGKYDHHRLKLVLQTAGLDTLIAHYPHGINQLITENGNNLSGGQRQRMMLARALYKDFDLLILDEPFNELDDASELKILADLKRLTDAGKMILFITHNQQSLGFCNKIITLHEA